MKLSKVATAAVLIAVLLPSVASACPVCFGASGTPAAKAMNNAILFLLSVVGFLQMGFVALFFTWWRRARNNGGVQ